MQEAPIAQGPVDVNVRGDVYALCDPAGLIRAAGITLDSVTRTLIEKEMAAPMWNAIFGNSDPVARARIYEKHGWRVMQGTFTPNAKVTGSPALSASPSGLPGYADGGNGERK